MCLECLYFLLIYIPVAKLLLRLSLFVLDTVAFAREFYATLEMKIMIVAQRHAFHIPLILCLSWFACISVSTAASINNLMHIFRAIMLRRWQGTDRN